MNPDEMDDAQMMRLVTLGMAIVWTMRRESDMAYGELFRVAENLGCYIETGEFPS